MTTQPIEPREAEAVPVTLMRIEGMVGSVAKDITHLTEKVTDLRTEVVEHRIDIGVIKSQVQQLESDAKAAAKGVVDADKAREETAAALEKQTADMVAKAKAAVDVSTQRWTPAMRLYATLGALAALVAVVAWVLSLFFGV